MVCACASLRTSDSDCDDGRFCNGVETCDGCGICQPGEPLDLGRSLMGTDRRSPGPSPTAACATGKFGSTKAPRADTVPPVGCPIAGSPAPAPTSEPATTSAVLPGRTVVADLGLPGPADSAAPYGLAPLGKKAQGYEEYRRASDGAVVVKIPAGEFLMGNQETERNPLEHQVYVSGFLMDKTGVTWGQYKRFAAATGTPLPPEPHWGIHDDHPVVFVTYRGYREGDFGFRCAMNAHR